MIESEMFGYTQGAFTGSRRGGQVGKLELADGGTLFLDEVGELPLDMQAKLLRVLQDGYITRLGDSKPVQVDVRVIAATNENLYQKVQRKEFRQDLYFRLGVIEITLPPLREHLEDIEALAVHILERLSLKVETRHEILDRRFLQKLRSYSWPGNVRELSNFLERVAVLGEGAALALDGPGCKPESGINQRQASMAGLSMPEAQAMAIEEALRQCRGNISLAARTLRVSRSTMYRRMREMGINRKTQVGAG